MAWAIAFLYENTVEAIQISFISVHLPLCYVGEYVTPKMFSLHCLCPSIFDLVKVTSKSSSKISWFMTLIPSIFF